MALGIRGVMSLNSVVTNVLMYKSNQKIASRVHSGRRKKVLLNTKVGKPRTNAQLTMLVLRQRWKQLVPLKYLYGPSRSESFDILLLSGMVIPLHIHLSFKLIHIRVLLSKKVSALGTFKNVLAQSYAS